MAKYISYDNMEQIVAILLERLSLKSTVYTKEDIDTRFEDYELVKAGAALGVTSLQKHQDISNKADKATTLDGYGITDAYTKEEIDAKVSAVFSYKGSVEAIEDLPITNNVGDVYEVKSESANYSWNGTEWTILGAMVDISNKADIADTLAGYGIIDAYTKDDLSAIINNNNPVIEDSKSYIVKGGTAFYNYRELSLNLYLMERQADGFHALNPMGGSGLFVTNNTEEAVTIILKVRPYADYTAGAYKYGYANGNASPSDINYALSGSDTTVLSTSVARGETIIPLTIPSGMKGFFIVNNWNDASYGPLEITECYTNDILSVSDEFQGMTIKTEALLPMPMILTREEYDAIEPKKNTCMYYIIEE